MTQPDHVPMQASDRVRPSMLLPPPRHWYLDRPGDPVDLTPPSGPRFGSPGPDLGYGLKLARRLEHELQLTEGEHAEDAVAGGFACGARRAAFFGRAPVIHDMRWAFGLWGFLGGAPGGLVEWRKPLFRGAAEHYWDQREIVDAVKVDALKLTPDQVLERLDNWKDLLIV
ncbi:MAG TPA: hypothetical protein VFN68_00190 [Acidimicrobiales bacterium]|nr:hypothetical protein [Acidimicrobiales bacterium]